MSTSETNNNAVRTIVVGGAAGDGIREAGLHIAELLHRIGYKSFLSFNYPSLIRGGHNFSRISFAKEKVWSDHAEIDILIAVNADSVRAHLAELKKDAVVFVEESYANDLKDIGAAIVPIPLSAMAGEIKARPVARTSAAIGAMCHLAGLSIEKTKELISGAFSDVGSEVNVALSEKGFLLAESRNLPKWSEPFIETAPVQNAEIIDGNRAVAKGFLAAGIEWYIAYPMTPSTSILHFLAKEAVSGKLKTVQPEDEIGGINMALGVSYAGKRVAVGTATGGFALMQEAVSFAGVSELPIAIAVSQRQGPATGVPTNTSQGDMQFVRHSGHGEFPRILIAPGDPEEAYAAAGNALNLTQKYQMPAIVLLDKHLSESSETSFLDSKKIIPGEAKKWEGGEETYARYRLTEDGVSPITAPGTPGAIVRGTSYEHEESGISTEDPLMVRKMTGKRFVKMTALHGEMARYETVKSYGDEESDTAVIFFGSVKSAVLESAKYLKRPVKFIQILWIEPLDSQKVIEKLEGVEFLIGVEGNHDSQLSALLREKIGTDTDYKINRFDSKPFDPVELAAEINSLLQ